VRPTAANIGMMHALSEVDWLSTIRMQLSQVRRVERIKRVSMLCRHMLAVARPWRALRCLEGQRLCSGAAAAAAAAAGTLSLTDTVRQRQVTSSDGAIEAKKLARSL
jgi:hypothetical protein